MLKKAYKGFTLLELMIVVAIIGVLAAVAIPGFMAYIRNSKTAEAKTNLDSIKKGAIAFFEAEHYTDKGLQAVTKQYPASEKTAVKIAPDTLTVGVKQRPEDYAEAFNKSPWRFLNFKISGPFYYGYKYDSITAVDAKGQIDSTKAESLLKNPNPGSTFHVVACASLNEKNDSAYTLTGLATGFVGAPVEYSGAVGSCPTAKAPTVKAELKP